MNIIIFEDKNNGFLLPFSINHSSAEIRVGAFTNFDRIKLLYPNSNFILIVNEILKDITKERFSECEINPISIPKGICLNASAIFKHEHFDF